MWTRDTRRQHSRDHLSYPRSLTDAEWQIVIAYLSASPANGHHAVDRGAACLRRYRLRSLIVLGAAARRHPLQP